MRGVRGRGRVVMGVVWEGCEWLWEVDGERDGDGRGS